MKRIEMFETTDGERFDSAEAAADHEADLAHQVCDTLRLAADKAEREAETASTVGALRLALAQYREAHRAAVAWAAAEYRARCSWRA